MFQLVLIMLYSLSTVGCHILAQKNTNPVAYDEPSLLSLAGLTQKHQVQNGGSFVCQNCNGEFDSLKRYICRSGWRQVDLKVVKETNSTAVNDDKVKGN